VPDEFVSLHRHDHFSLYDGFGTAKQAAAYAAELGQPALALTNHGNINGLVEHYDACREVGVKPILGCEIYFQPSFRPGAPTFHLTLLCMNNVGYVNLCKMLTEANATQFHRNPIITYKMLRKYNAGLILLTGCLGSITSQAILQSKPDALHGSMRFYKKVFGDRFYLELQASDQDDQRIVNRALLEYARMFDLADRTVLTNDAHYIRKLDYPQYQTMWRMNDREMGVDYSGLHMLSGKEVLGKYLGLMGRNKGNSLNGSFGAEMIARTVEIADRCNVDLTFDEMTPDLGFDEDSNVVLRKMAIAGLKREKRTTSNHKKRLARELKVISKLGFADYFVMCADMVQFARSKNIGVGYGRGSVCGSLVAFALGLSQVDPLEHDTLFERFLRTDKTAMPDVDLDFESARRDEVIQYVLQRYEGKAAPISTYGYYRGKNLANDLIKLFDPPETAAAKFKAIASALGSVDHVTPEHFPLVVHKALEDYPEIIPAFCSMHGQVRYIGRHAAGVAIAAGDITNYLVLQRVRGEMQTSFDLASLSSLGVLKFDILGLNTVDIIKSTEKLIPEVPNLSTAIKSNRVYAEFQRGNNAGVFQFERGSGVHTTQDVKPKNFSELVACNALNRPGPKSLGMIDAYVHARDGDYDSSTPYWKYTQDTHGVVVYQEQVMEICRGISRMTWPQIDKLLYQIGRKKIHPKTRKRFVLGAERYSGMSRDDALKLFDNMTQYLFNKGHSTGYSLLSAYCMWLKVHYPLEFWSSVLQHENNRAKRQGYRVDASRDGAVFMIPHVNHSHEVDVLGTYDGDQAILEGLATIKGIGPKAARVIIDERIENGDYTSIEDFESRVPGRVVNTKVRSLLLEYGALEFNEKRYVARCIQYNGVLIGRGLS
jgi:DNA polymerase-3 subunit alpha